MRVLHILALAVLLAVACMPDAAVLRAPERAADATLGVRVLGPQGAVSGAGVCAIGITNDERCGTTGADGRVGFAVAPGIYFVSVAPPAGSRLAPKATAVDARQPVDLTVALEGRGLISGTVRAADGPPAAGASVCAHPTSDDRIVCGRTASDGTYRLAAQLLPYRLFVEGPPDGSRLVSQWGFGRVESFEADIVDVRWSDVVGADHALVRGVVLSGVVRARGGGPIQNAQVCTQTLAEPLPWACERTDREGRYAALREPGRYWLWTIPPDDAGRLLAQRFDGVDVGIDATPVVLEADRAIDVALREGALVRGRVVTDDGAPVASALVCIDTPFTTGRICRPTDAQGRYSVAVRPATYVIQVVPPSESDAISEYWAHARDWTEADAVRVAGADVAVDIALRRGVRLTGMVRTADGVPVEAAPVNVNDARGFLAGTYTDHRGRYSIAVPLGDIEVDVFAPRVSQLVSRLGTPLPVRGETGLDVVLEFAEP